MTSIPLYPKLAWHSSLYPNMPSIPLYTQTCLAFLFTRTCLAFISTRTCLSFLFSPTCLAFLSTVYIYLNIPYIPLSLSLHPSQCLTKAKVQRSTVNKAPQTNTDGGTTVVNQARPKFQFIPQEIKRANPLPPPIPCSKFSGHSVNELTTITVLLIVPSNQKQYLRRPKFVFV